MHVFSEEYWHVVEVLFGYFVEFGLFACEIEVEIDMLSYVYVFAVIRNSLSLSLLEA